MILSRNIDVIASSFEFYTHSSKDIWLSELLVRANKKAKKYKELELKTKSGSILHPNCHPLHHTETANLNSKKPL